MIYAFQSATNVFDDLTDVPPPDTTHHKHPDVSRPTPLPHRQLVVLCLMRITGQYHVIFNAFPCGFARETRNMAWHWNMLGDGTDRTDIARTDSAVHKVSEFVGVSNQKIETSDQVHKKANQRHLNILLFKSHSQMLEDLKVTPDRTQIGYYAGLITSQLPSLIGFFNADCV